MTNYEIDSDVVTLHRSDRPGVIGQELARQPAPKSGDVTFTIPPGPRQFVCIVSWLRGARTLISDRLEFAEEGGEISFGPFPLVVTANEKLVNKVRVTTAKRSMS